MNARPRGRRIALATGLCVLVIGLAVIVWYREEIRTSYTLWVNFERLPDNAQGYPEYLHEQTKIVFVRLPGGPCVLGNDRRFLNPRRNVVLHSFLIAKYEVSQAQWTRVMESNPSTFRGGDLPVETVTFDDCETFCETTGLALPAESEWEFACRAGTATAFTFGDDLLPTQANFYTGANSDTGKTVPIDSFEPNGFGLYNVHGNVFEWCHPYNREVWTILRNRPLRGGSHDEDKSECRSAWSHIQEGEASNHYGFRPIFSLR